MLQVVSSQPQEEVRPTWELFWSLYPRRVAKKDAEKAWSRMKEAERFDAIVALVDWRRVWVSRGEMEFVPYPATWLNGERWTDELPQDCSPRHASHAPAKPREEVERGEMPQAVRDAIARLRR